MGADAAGGDRRAGVAEPQLLSAAELRQRLRECLASGRCPPDELRIGAYPKSATDQLRHLFPAQPTRAAVLVPLVDHRDEMTVLLTHRAADLVHHPGQIAFPGGRVEPQDTDEVAAALRETEEEIGLQREFVEVIGRLPDHFVITGYRVTPVVALVRPGFRLSLDPTEVSGAFEAPLRHLLDPGTHALRKRQIGDVEFEVYDLPWGGHNIWGATAGMLLTLRELLGGRPPGVD